MIRNMIASIAAAMLVAAPCAAQTAGSFGAAPAPLDARATIGITVPIGGRRGDVASRPRAELRLGQSAGSVYLGDRGASLRAIGLRGSDGFAPAPSALAITLGAHPRVLAAGRLLGADQDETPEDDDGIDTLEGIGIGVGALLVVGAIGFAALVIHVGNCERSEECN